MRLFPEEDSMTAPGNTVLLTTMLGDVTKRNTLL